MRGQRSEFLRALARPLVEIMLRETAFAFLSRHKRSLACLLVILAAALYIYGVPYNPPGFYIDESSISYNAYTISQSGRDEHGLAWPLFFRAFGDYKNPVYIYLLAGLFKLSGPSITVARLFSAASGFLAALLLGLLAARIARRSQVGLLCGLSALLTPWLFETSRVVMEVALYPFALALFLLCLHHASTKARWSPLDVAGLAAALALLTYTYSIGRLLAPLLACGLLLFATRERWPSVLQTWCAYLLTLIPLFLFNRRHAGALTARFKIITYITPESSYDEITQDFIRHYAGNLNPWRLLVSGDPNPDQVAHIFGAPLMLAATAVLALAGGCLVLTYHRRSAWWRFVFYGLVVSVVPSSLTDDYFHMLRLIALPIFLLVLSVPALAWLIEKAGTRREWRILFTLLVASTLLQGALFQCQFHLDARTPRRLHLFDADYPQTIFARALTLSSGPVHLADAPSIPGYIQAYWYATLRGIDLSRLVRLDAAEPPPMGAVVISTEEHCLRCRTVATSEPYTLYIVNAPPRQRGPLAPEGFHAEIYPPELPETLRAGEKRALRLRVKNVSARPWLARERSGEPYQLSLGNRWLDPAGRTLADHEGRSPLLRDLLPGEETELSLTIRTPREAGEYLLEIDMLQEGVGWFGPRGSQARRLRVRVE